MTDDKTIIHDETVPLNEGVIRYESSPVPNILCFKCGTVEARLFEEDGEFKFEGPANEAALLFFHQFRGHFQAEIDRGVKNTLDEDRLLRQEAVEFLWNKGILVLVQDIVDIYDLRSSRKPLVSNQGQALDGFSELANYRSLAAKLKAIITENSSSTHKDSNTPKENK